MNISDEMFEFVHFQNKITDKRLETKPVGYFKDAFRRFKKNKSSVVAAIIILMLALFAFIVPFFSHYTVNFRDGYYKMVLPKSSMFSFLGWDGCSWQTVGQAGYDVYSAIDFESSGTVIRKEKTGYVSDAVNKQYRLYLDSYEKVGFVYIDLDSDEYFLLQDYQNKTGVQIMYPIPENWNVQYQSISNSANYWYKLENESKVTTGTSKYHDENGKPVFVDNYIRTSNSNYAQYQSLRISSDNGGEDGNQWLIYARRNQTGYRVRVLYKNYYKYKNGYYANHLMGTNQHGQDLFVCLAVGARLSFILAISVSLINFFIGVAYGAIEGYYGGVADLIMERFSDILGATPFIVIATLFQMHFAHKVGPILSLLFSFVITGWLGIAQRVRTQFYRFKNSEYVLASRTLGARDFRLIFRHIFPNSLGTIITSSVLIIPGVIFSESMLSYLGIVSLESSGLTSIGNMLSNGQAYLSTFPHIIMFPAVFISLLEISFNLFGNGLRDAFNPSLRGAQD